MFIEFIHLQVSEKLHNQEFALPLLKQLNRLRACGVKMEKGSTSFVSRSKSAKTYFQLQNAAKIPVESEAHQYSTQGR